MNSMRCLTAALVLLAAQQVSAEDSPRTIYVLNCAGCHGLDGAGDIDAHVPPLAYAGSLMEDPEGRRYIVNVAGILASTLSYSDTAKVLNWIKAQYAKPTSLDSLPDFDAEEVKDLRGTRPADIVQLRRQIAKRLKERGIEIPGYPWP